MTAKPANKRKVPARRVFLRALPALALATPVAAEVPAGTAVENRATARFTVNGQDAQAASNTDRLLVAERLDVRLAAGPAGANGAVPVLLTNTGNGQEAFNLSASAAGDSVRVVADLNGNGRADPDEAATDRTPVLAAGASVPLLVLLSRGATAATLEARAVTGSGAPGTSFSGLGDGGSDAVVGATRADVRISVVATDTAPTLAKSQAVLAPDGSARAVTGAVVTYRLEARFPAAAAGAEIADELPAGLTFVSGSLRLDGAVLRDDDGFDGTAVRVALGDIAGPAVRIVQFQCRIN
jgi:uncharacterized repeat protein (TIGR01451 family)